MHIKYVLNQKHEACSKHDKMMLNFLWWSQSLTDPVSPDTLQWADGFLLVYSIIDRQSFNYIKRIKQQLLDFRNGECGGGAGGNSSLTVTSLPLSPSTGTLSVHSSSNNGSTSPRADSNGSPAPVPMVLVANKGDMVHLRQISTEEGEILAKDLDCTFAEVAASEQVAEVAEVFHEVCRDVQAARRKTKQSLLDRVLGNKAAAGLRVYARGKSDSALPKEN